MRIGAVTVGELQAVVDPAVLGNKRGDATHRGVDVQPQLLTPADLSDLWSGVERRRTRRSARGADEERNEAVGAVLGDHPRKFVGAHCERVVMSDDAHPCAADASDAQTFLGTAVCLRGGIGHERGRVAIGVDGAAGDAPACGENRRQRCFRGGTLDDAATCYRVATETVGETEQLLHPVEHQGLDLCARRTRHPTHSLHAQSGRSEFAENCRVRRVGREVGEEVRMLPVGQTGDDDVVHVAQDIGERFRSGRWMGGEHRPDIAGQKFGVPHRKLLDVLDVLRDPIDQGMAVLAELVGRHDT